MLINVIGLAVGFTLLWFAGNRVITNALEVAYLFSISPLFIAFPILPLATGLPELLVALQAVFADASILSAGDIIGSNFIDVSLVLGVPAILFGPLLSNIKENKRQIILLVLTAILMGGVFSIGTLYPIHGCILLLVYALSVYYFWRHRADGYIPKSELGIDKKIEQFGLLGARVRSGLKLLVSLVLIVIGARLGVANALEVARDFHIALGVIGTVIFSVGTSLPEIVIAFLAAKRGAYSLAFGTSFGSILQQGSMILGVLAVASKSPIDISSIILILPFMLAAYLIVGYGIVHRRRISRFQGVLLIVLYIGYLAAELLKK